METQRLNEMPAKSVYRCLACPKEFKYFTSLIQHELTHAPENRNEHKSRTKRSEGQAMIRPHECATCGKRFTLQENLNRHQVIHTSNRPFHCTHCPKSFRLSQHLKEHTRIHTGEKPYKCTICGHAFCQISNLKSHQKTHSKDKSFKCNQCDKAFRRSFTLKQHKTTHVPPQNIILPRATTSQRLVIKHVYPQINSDDVFTKESQMKTQKPLRKRHRKQGESYDIKNNFPVHHSTMEHTKPSDTFLSKNSQEQINALQSRYLPLSKFCKEPRCEFAISENSKAVDYKWKREIYREWMPASDLISKEPPGMNEHRDNGDQLLSFKNKGPTRISSEESDAWSPNSIASSHHENNQGVEKSQNAEDESYTPSEFLRKRSNSQETPCSPRTPTTGSHKIHEVETAKYLRMKADNTYGGSFFNSGLNYMNLQDLAQQVPFVPLIEWKPVITGWRNIIDGQIYTKSAQPPNRFSSYM